LKAAWAAAALVAAVAATLWWWRVHDASGDVATPVTREAPPKAVAPLPAAPPQSAHVTGSKTRSPAPASASAADTVVWQLCGMDSVTLPAAAAAAAASASIDPLAALPDHLGSAAVDAARPALMAALDAGPPRWRAAAVLLRGSNARGDPALPALRELAAATADPVIAMWASELCLRADDCTGPDSQRWLDLEPDNLAPWLWRLASAAPAGEAQLKQMAATQRFDLHWATLLEVVLNAMPAAVTPYLQRQFWIEAIGIQVAFALPGLSQLTAACVVPLDDGSPRRAACGAIARTMADQSDTALGTGIGLRLAERNGMPQAEAQARRAAINDSVKLRQDPFNGPQPLSCKSIERARAWLQQLASLGEMGSLRAASAPR
jgi:hypothetical protein